MPKSLPVGFTFAGVAAGIKNNGAADFALVVSDRACSGAAVFTRNAFPAAPVLYDRALVAENSAGLRAVAVNAGCANACTGDQGLTDAGAMAAATEVTLDLPARSVAVMSTGVIGPRLPMDKVETGVQLAARQLATEGWEAASRAIMTTDTRPKVAYRTVGDASLWGMAKGAGMIHPNMATMLSVIATDAAVSPRALDAMLRAAVDMSFNCISVDGDMSTNDTVLALANGAVGAVDHREFAVTLTDLCTDLAQQIIRDGEGATKFITIRVLGATSDSDARTAAKAIANSPLVKTAFYGGDANWGRILAAVGYSGARVNPTEADLWIATGTEDATSGAERVQLVQNGKPMLYSEEAASAIFGGKEIAVSVDLGLGAAHATVWTCDLSHAYVDINGHYRT